MHKAAAGAWVCKANSVKPVQMDRPIFAWSEILQEKLWRDSCTTRCEVRLDRPNGAAMPVELGVR